VLPGVLATISDANWYLKKEGAAASDEVDVEKLKK
jgi:hypothetical protein